MSRVSPKKASSQIEPVWTRQLDGYPTALATSLDGLRLFVGTDQGDIACIESETGTEQWRVRAHTQGVLSLAVHSHAIASGGQDGHAALTAVQGEPLRRLPGGANWIEHVAWSRDGSRLATAAGKVVRVWSHEGDPAFETQPHASTVTALAWSPRTGEIATTCYGGCYLWPIQSGANPRHLPFKGSLISLAWSPDESIVACGSQDCSVHFWRLKTGQDSEMTGYPFKPKSLSWDSRSSLLATAGDATICVWDFAGKGPEGTQPIELKSHQGQVTAVAFHPRKALLASVAQDMGMLVWEPRVSRRPIAFGLISDSPEHLAWDPEGHRLFTTDASGNLCSWDLGTRG